jgi:hypothetical protein
MLADGEAGSGAAGLVLMRVALADAGGGTGAAANIGDTGLWQRRNSRLWRGARAEEAKTSRAPESRRAQQC